MLMPNNTCIVSISGLTCGPTQDPQDADLFVGTAQDATDLLQLLQRHYVLSDDDLVNLRLFLWSTYKHSMQPLRPTRCKLAPDHSVEILP